MDIAQYLKLNRMNFSGANPDLSAIQGMQPLPVQSPSDSPPITQPQEQDATPQVSAPPDPTGTNTDSVPENIPQQTDEGIATDPSKYGFASRDTPGPNSNTSLLADKLQAGLSPTPVSNPQANNPNPAMSGPPQDIYQQGPKELAYQKMLESQPLHSDYHPNVGRRILAGIIGGLGSFHDPKLAMQQANSVKDAPYLDKLKDYQQQLGVSKFGSDQEAAQNKGLQTYYLNKATIDKENALAEQEKAHMRYYDSGGLPSFVTNSPNPADAAYRYNAAKHPSALNHDEGTVTLNDGTSVHGFRDPATRDIFLSNGNKLDPSKIQDFKITGKVSQSSGSGHLYNVTTTDGKQIHAFRQPDNSFIGVDGKPITNVSDAVEKDPSEEKDPPEFREFAISQQLLQKEAANPGTVAPDRLAAAKMVVQKVNQQQANVGSEIQNRQDVRSDRQDAKVEQSRNNAAKVIGIIDDKNQTARGELVTAENSLNTNNPKSASIVAPLIWKIASDGARGNNAEYSQIVGGRTILQSLADHAQALSRDPDNAKPFSPQEVQWMKQMIAVKRKEADEKSNAANDARVALLNSNDPKDHFATVNKFRQRVSDSGNVQSGVIKMKLPDGRVIPNIDPSKKADFIKKYPGSMEAN